MTSKRKRENVNVNESDVRMKRQRRRKRSRSEPGLLHDPVNAEKLQVLKRLFGRNCSSGYDGETTSSGANFERSETFERNETNDAEEQSDDNEDFDSGEFSPDLENQNSDPLLDSVPVNLDPEQLGFLVCAQETLRFLYRRGFAIEHPVFTRLRSRLLRGMDELAVA